MDQESFFGQADVRAAVLPARAAYLVRANDRQAALSAVREASTRWAGVTEPIIPVRANGRIDEWLLSVIELSKVDCLVNVNLPMGLACAVATAVRLPVVDIVDIAQVEPTRSSVHPVFVGAESEQGADRPPNGMWWLTAPEQGSLWQSFAIGDLRSYGFRQFPQVMLSRISESSDIADTCLAQIQGTSWLDFGARYFREGEAAELKVPTPTIIWLTKRNSLRDCVYFWNLRALRLIDFPRGSILLMPVAPGIDWHEIADQLATCLRRPDEVEPDVLLDSFSVDRAAMDDIAALMGLVPSSEPPYCVWAGRTPAMRQAPYTFRTDIDPRAYVKHSRQYGESTGVVVSVFRSGTRIEFDSPVAFRGPGGVLVRFRSKLFEGLPKHAATAALFHDEAIWSEDRLQLRAGTANDYRFEISIPSLREAAWALIRDCCDQTDLSVNGRTAVRLLELDGHEVLLDGNVRASIEALRTRRPKEVVEHLERFDGSGQLPEAVGDLTLHLGETQQRRFRSVTQLRSAAGNQSARSAEVLCQQGWAERGFSIRCEVCSVRSFVPMGQTQPTSLCPACQAPQPYETDKDGAPVLQYRLHALIDHAADQGVLPHVMAIAALSKHDEGTFLIPGADVEFSDGTRREVDLFGIHDGTVVAGEAKTSPTGLEKSDLESDIKLTAALGADAHLMVAIGDIAESVVAQAKQITDAADLGLILIEGARVTYVGRDDGVTESDQ